MYTQTIIYYPTNGRKRGNGNERKKVFSNQREQCEGGSQYDVYERLLGGQHNRKGYSKESIRELRKPDFCGRLEYPNYAFTNNNANIHRVEERLNSLKATKEKGNFEQEYKTFRVVENTEGCRENMMKIEFLRQTEYDRYIYFCSIC